LGTQLLGGRELGTFAAGLLPLIDGTRSRAEIARAAGAELAAHASQLLDLLDRRGLLHESSPDEHPMKERLAPLPFPDLASEDESRLASATVTLYGLQPWGTEAVRHLMKAGVGRVVMVEPDNHDDSAGLFNFVNRLAGEAPHCDVRWIPAHRLHAHLSDVPPSKNLLLIALGSLDVRRHLDIARLAQATRTQHVYGTLKGLEGIVGPLVTPGVSACWNCCRLREAACSSTPWAERLVQAVRATQNLPAASPAPDAGPLPVALGAHLALAALKFLAAPTTNPPGGLQVHNFVTAGTTHHYVARMPRCEVCSGPPRPSGPPAPARRSPMTVRELHDYLVDPRIGIVRRAGTLRSDICPTLIRAYAILSSYTEDTDLRDGQSAPPGPSEWCGGRAFTEDEALMSALGESVERYCAAVPPRTARTARARDLDGDVLDPRSLGLYSPQQYARPGFPYHPYDPQAQYAWVRGVWLDCTGEVWLPADQVHYRARGGVLAQVTTNGLAAGRDREDAAQRATLELIERDALLRAWFTRTPPARLDIGSGSCVATGHRVARLVQDLEAHGLAVRFYLLPAAGGVPVVLCLGLGDGLRWPAATVTTAAHPSGPTAVEKAVLEQAQTVFALRDVIEGGRRPLARDSDVVTFIDHALRYAGPGAQRSLSFLMSSSEVVKMRDLPDPPADEKSTARLAARLGTPVAIADVTSDDIAVTGLRVVRALAPGLQPLHCGAGLERLGDSRQYGAKALYTTPHPMC
jgi:ribosomal protein S12 methylthiotransferase accessory factor